MQLPIVKPAPIVTTHAEAFRHLFENQCQGTALSKLLDWFNGTAQQKSGQYQSVYIRECGQNEPLPISLPSTVEWPESQQGKNQVSVKSDS